MAAPKRATPVSEPEERVEVFIPRGSPNDDPNFFVSINGINYLLPRGKKSKVPAHVAFEIARAAAAQEAQDRRTEELISAAGN